MNLKPPQVGDRVVGVDGAKLQVYHVGPQHNKRSWVCTVHEQGHPGSMEEELVITKLGVQTGRWYVDFDTPEAPVC